jgi:fission 1 protein
LILDIYRDYASRRRECLYYLALGHLKLGNYGDSKRIIELFLKEEPRNIQGLALLDLIERRVSDGKIL